MHQAIFQRCPHDRQNPYVMLSREMIHDKKISPNAKGVLAYLLSLPPNWQIYHSQLQEALNVGEDYINSVMDELIKEGYVDRKRERIKGMYQPYQYTIREFKKCLPNQETPFGEILDKSLDEMPSQHVLNQTGFTGPEKPELLIKEPLIKETTTKKDSRTAVASFPQKINKIYDCLEDVDICIEDKIEITATYSDDHVKHAVAWCRHPDTKITKTLVAALKWACKNLPEIPQKKEDIQQDNKSYASKYDGVRTAVSQISVLSSVVEISFPTSQKESVYISYDSKDFINILNEMLKKLGIPMID